MFVTIEDIKDIEVELNIELNDTQRDSVLKGYQRIVMDKGEDWDEIIRELIKERICQYSGLPSVMSYSIDITKTNI